MGFSLNKGEITTFVSSKGAFTSILLHPHQLPEASTRVVSKQELVLLLFVCLFIFCFSLMELSFRELLDIGNHFETSPGLLKY